MNGWFNFPDDIDKAPQSEGVYILSKTVSETGIVYVGRADDLHDRLSQHPDPKNPCLQRKSINYFAFEESGNSEDRERELINKYDPECNRE